MSFVRRPLAHPAHSFLIALAIVSLSPGVFADTLPPFPPGAEALEASLLAQLDPHTRVWVRQEGARQAASGGASEASVSQAVASNFGSSSGQDITALTMLVMVESARAMEADLKASAAKLKQINEARAALRKATQQGNATTADLRTAPSAVDAQVRPSPAPRGVLLEPPPRPNAEFETRPSYVTSDLDALNRSAELEMEHLQQVTSRRQSLMTGVSNTMKKVSDSQAAVARNLGPGAGCKAGFVWREARAEDRVCVPPDARARTAQENADAPNRVDPAGAYGPKTCVSAYVWRNAFEGDLVCVAPATRDLVAEENRLAATRRAGD